MRARLGESVARWCDHVRELPPAPFERRSSAATPEGKAYLDALSILEAAEERKRELEREEAEEVLLVLPGEAVAVTFAGLSSSSPFRVQKELRATLWREVDPTRPTTRVG